VSASVVDRKRLARSVCDAKTMVRMAMPLSAAADAGPGGSNTGNAKKAG